MKKHYDFNNAKRGALIDSEGNLTDLWKDRIVNVSADYVKKLERRIHNQRVRLRQLEMFEGWQSEHRLDRGHPRWFKKMMEQGKEICRLKKILN